MALSRPLETELVAALATATKRRKLAWQDVGGDSYCAQLAERSYALRWLYWYHASGITTGREGVILTCANQDVPILWGTSGFQVMQELLSAIDPKWLEYFRTLTQGYLGMCQTDLDSSPIGSINDASLTVLSLLLRCTEQGVISWKVTTNGGVGVSAHLNHHEVAIRFIRPIDYDDRPIDNVIAELTLAGATTAFACGTNGYRLAEQIMAFAFGPFRTKIESRTIALQAEIEFLKQVLSP